MQYYGSNQAYKIRQWLYFGSNILFLLFLFSLHLPWNLQFLFHIACAMLSGIMLLEVPRLRIFVSCRVLPAKDLQLLSGPFFWQKQFLKNFSNSISTIISHFADIVLFRREKNCRGRSIMIDCFVYSEIIFCGYLRNSVSEKYMKYWQRTSYNYKIYAKHTLINYDLSVLCIF